MGFELIGLPLIVVIGYLIILFGTLLTVKNKNKIIGAIVIFVGTIISACGTRNALSSHVTNEASRVIKSDQYEERKTRDTILNELSDLEKSNLPLLKEFMISELRPRIDQVSKTWKELYFCILKLKYPRNQNINELQIEFDSLFDKLYQDHQPLESAIKSTKSLIGDIKLNENSDMLPLHRYLDQLNNPFLQMTIQVSYADKNEKTEIPNIIERWYKNMREIDSNFGLIYEDVLKIEK